MVSERTMIGIFLIQKDSNMPIMVLPDTIWSFQALYRISICDRLKHQKRCMEVLFFSACMTVSCLICGWSQSQKFPQQIAMAVTSAICSPYHGGHGRPAVGPDNSLLHWCYRLVLQTSVTDYMWCYRPVLQTCVAAWIDAYV